MSRSSFASRYSVNVDSTAIVATDSPNWYGRASMKVVSGVVVLVYKKSSAHAVNDGALHIKFSNDYGATWTAEDTKIGGGAVSGFPMNPSTLSAGEDAGEPWLMIAPNGDLVLHMWRVDYSVTTNGTYQSISSDGGATWGTSTAIDFGGIVDDSVVFSTDDDFVTGGVIYAGARVYTTKSSDDPTQSILIKSTDNGATWSKVSVIMDTNEGGTGAEEVGLEYLGNNTIIAVLRDHPHTHTYQRISTDLGSTWGTLTDITSQVAVVGRMRVYTQAHLKGQGSWWTDPTLIMIGFLFQDIGINGRRCNAVWVSRDSGTTWSHALTVDNTVDDEGYGDIIWNPNTSQYCYISTYGTADEAVLKQYNIRIIGI